MSPNSEKIGNTDYKTINYRFMPFDVCLHSCEKSAFFVTELPRVYSTRRQKKDILPPAVVYSLRGHMTASLLWLCNARRIGPLEPRTFWRQVFSHLQSFHHNGARRQVEVETKEVVNIGFSDLQQTQDSWLKFVTRTCQRGMQVQVSTWSVAHTVTQKALWAKIWHYSKNGLINMPELLSQILPKQTETQFQRQYLFRFVTTTCFPFQIRISVYRVCVPPAPGSAWYFRGFRRFRSSSVRRWLHPKQFLPTLFAIQCHSQQHCSRWCHQNVQSVMNHSRRGRTWVLHLSSQSASGLLCSSPSWFQQPMQNQWSPAELTCQRLDLQSCMTRWERRGQSAFRDLLSQLWRLPKWCWRRRLLLGEWWGERRRQLRLSSVCGFLAERQKTYFVDHGRFTLNSL